MPTGVKMPTANIVMIRLDTEKDFAFTEKEMESTTTIPAIANIASPRKIRSPLTPSMMPLYSMASEYCALIRLNAIVAFEAGTSF